MDIVTEQGASYTLNNGPSPELSMGKSSAAEVVSSYIIRLNDDC